MKTNEFIQLSLAMSKNWACQLLEDMKDEPLAQPTSRGGNHPLWVLGHLVHAESFFFDECMQGKPHRFPESKDLFAAGTEPHTDAAKYPSMDQLLANWDKIRGESLALLDTLSAEDLDNATSAPEEFADFFGTNAKCFSAMIVHTSFHAGQVADARRAVGRKPLMM